MCLFIHFIKPCCSIVFRLFYWLLSNLSFLPWSFWSFLFGQCIVCDERSSSHGWIPCLPIISHNMCPQSRDPHDSMTCDRSHASPKEGIAEWQYLKILQIFDEMQLYHNRKGLLLEQRRLPIQVILPLKGILHPWFKCNSCAYRPCAQTNNQIDTNL